MLLLTLNTLESTTVTCDYNQETFWVVKNKLQCYVTNPLGITSQDSALITSVNGAPKTGEIYFNAYNMAIQYLPRGLQNFFWNLTGIKIEYGRIKSLQQSDLEPYKNLEFLYLDYNDITEIEKDLFNNNPNLQVVSLYENKIFYIHPNAFNPLKKLTSVDIRTNSCTDIDVYVENNETQVARVIDIVRDQCHFKHESNNKKLEIVIEKLKEIKTQMVNYNVMIELNDMNITAEKSNPVPEYNGSLGIKQYLTITVVGITGLVETICLIVIIKWFVNQN